MFVIERRIAALFRAALRRCHDGPTSRADQIPVLARLTKNGLFMHVRQEEYAILYHHPDVRGKGVFAFPASVLGLMEGRTADPVEISLQRPDLAQARWTDRGTPRSVEIPLLEPGLVAIPPELPREFTPLPMHFMPALYEASRTAATQDTKYIVTKVQLRGKSGTIVSTDTRQLLVQGGYEFPFKEDLLLPKCEVFGLQPLHTYEDVGIGRTETHVAIRIGPWTFVFTLAKEGRYPDTTQIIPRSSRTAAYFRLHPNDAQRFLDNLVRRIKGPAAKEHAVTLDLIDSPCLRFEIDGRVIEIALSESEVKGEPVRMVLNLAQFLRAIELRFLEFEIQHPDKPIVAREGERIYMSMSMPAHAAILPQSDVDRPSAAESSAPAIRETRPIATAEEEALAPIATVPAVASTAMVVVPKDQQIQSIKSESLDVFLEAEGFTSSVMRAAAHAGKLLRFLRGVCAQPQIVHVVRNSLLTLLDKSPKE